MRVLKIDEWILYDANGFNVALHGFLHDQKKRFKKKSLRLMFQLLQMGDL